MREKSEISRILAKEKSLKPLKFQGLLVRHEGLEPPTFAFSSELFFNPVIAMLPYFQAL